MQRLHVQPGDVYLLCSDGLYEPLGDEGLCSRMAQTHTARETELLVEAAHTAGGRDNITAVRVRVLSC